MQDYISMTADRNGFQLEFRKGLETKSGLITQALDASRRRTTLLSRIIPRSQTLRRKNSILETRMKGESPIIQMIKLHPPTVLMIWSTQAQLRFGKNG
jgi:hypothetical protein